MIGFASNVVSETLRPKGRYAKRASHAITLKNILLGAYGLTFDHLQRKEVILSY